MRINRARIWSMCLAASVAVGGVYAVAQEQPKKDPVAEMEAWMKMNAPGDEHKAIAKLAGTWDCDVTSCNPANPEEKQKSKGKETSKMILDGRYLESHMEGDMAGMKFAGRGLLGYDKMKKKYVTTWVDSMSTGIMYFEGTADATGKVITMTSESPNPTGKMDKWRSVSTFVDDNHHTFDMYVTPSGETKETLVMSIKYTRAK